MRRRPFMRCNRGLRKSMVSAFSDCCLARRRKAEASMWEFGPCEPRLIPLIGIGGQPHRRLSDPSPAHKLSAPGLTRGVSDSAALDQGCIGGGSTAKRKPRIMATEGRITSERQQASDIAGG